MYTYDEVLLNSKEYFNGEELSAKVFADKYALRDNDGNILELTPADMHRRIAKELARIEKKKFKKPLSEDEIFAYLDKFERIIPQGSAMNGIGNPHQYVTLSNCYVLHSPEDSYGSILKTDEELVQISKRRGGVGIDISHLRPRGTPTTNSARTSSGAVAFAERYSNSIREVGQYGRRGALMLSLNVHHPDVLEFASVKKDLTKVTGANISVQLTDEFLQAVTDKTDYEQRWPIDAINLPTIANSVDAPEVWKQIIENAHAMAEPGLLFWDNIIRESPADCYSEFGYRTIATNPCGELPLSALDSCRLLLLNLFGYITDPFTRKAKFDFTRFYADAQIAQRFMDNIIDLELEAINRIIKKIEKDPQDTETKRAELNTWKQIRKTCATGRRTGTGVTAVGDTIAALGLKYGSNRSIEVIEDIYKVLKLGCYKSSVDIAKELGPFEVFDWNLEKDCDFIKRIADDKFESDDLTIYGSDIVKAMSQYGRRNISLLTTAPAGSVSIVAKTTSGIEPLFMIFFIRRKKGNPGDDNFRVDYVDDNGDNWMEFKVYHPKVKLWMDITGKTDITESPWYGCCAEDIDWKQRVKLQAAAQRHVDHAISSTINLPEDVSVEQVAEIYETAWKAGCKGITVYRKNCRSGVLVDEVHKEFPEKRPKRVDCDVHHITVRGKEYFVLVGMMYGRPYEVFAGQNGFIKKKIKTGVIVRARKGVYRAELGEHEILPQDLCSDEEEALTRLASIFLQAGGDIHNIVTQLEKTRGDMMGFGKCVARALKKYIPDGTSCDGESCPECGSQEIQRQEGCQTCKVCGYSKCS